MHFLVKLRFKRALSLGEFSRLDEGLPLGTIHSDTLFSALLNQWVKIPGACGIHELVTALNSCTPPFLLSSAFPFSSSGYYLPIPRGTSEVYMNCTKGLSYLELNDFIRLANGEKSHLENMGSRDPAADLILPTVTPRVTIDRISSATNLFQLGAWTMAPGSGLYFLLDLKEEALKRSLETSIGMLGDAGIGADRSAGCGGFEGSMEALSDDSAWSDLLRPKEGEGLSYCTLSLCCPSRDKETGEYKEALQAISYRILSRSGWIGSSSSWVQAKRRECKMFAEGSLFEAAIAGCVADVTPSFFEKEHKVFRYGLGMMIGGEW